MTDHGVDQAPPGAIERAIWSLLEHVPDPEIPVLSVVDLGIVRDVTCAPGESPRVSITPTYSGCPATAVIRRDIEHCVALGWLSGRTGCRGAVAAVEQ
jgi:ring-1,2-phenylacetyl-CoA epoxidase subunit PaaD